MNKQLELIIERLQGAKAMTILMEMWEDTSSKENQAAKVSQEALLTDAKALLDELAE